MIVYGKNPVIEALRSGKDIEKVLVAHDSHPPHQVVKLCKEKGIKIQKVPRVRIEQLAGTKKNPRNYCLNKSHKLCKPW